nr:phospholipase-like protein [Tanacetum cinerariifolium]
MDDVNDLVDALDDLVEEHIKLWVSYMWHFIQSCDDWSMVSCYFLTLLLQDLMSLFYATNEIYPLVWRDVEQNSVNSEEPNLSTRPTQVEVPKELPKVSMVNSSLKKLKYHLASFDMDFYNSRKCAPLTRITTTAKVPLRKPIPLGSNTSKPVVTLVYSQKPKESRNNVPVRKSKINKSLSTGKKEPNKSWGFIISNVPSSSTVECMLSKLFSGIWTPDAPST